MQWFHLGKHEEYTKLRQLLQGIGQQHMLQHENKETNNM